MGQYSSKIKHIFFDLDHTLWDHDANSKTTLADLYLEMKLEDLSGVAFDYFIDRYIKHNERCWDLFRQDKLSKAQLRVWRFDLALGDIGIHEKKLSRQLAEAYMEHGPKQTKLIPGAALLLAQLKPHFHLHILSNGFHEGQITKLRYSGIHEFFEHVITSEKASVKKPNSRIFDFALKQTQANAIESLMIGDHLEIDVIGAIEAGWSAIHYNPTGVAHKYESVANLVELGERLLK